jgi:hypothetical protein
VYAGRGDDDPAFKMGQTILSVRRQPRGRNRLLPRPSGGRYCCRSLAAARRSSRTRAGEYRQDFLCHSPAKLLRYRLLIPQRFHRIGFRRTPCRQIRGQRRNH